MLDQLSPFIRTARYDIIMSGPSFIGIRMIYDYELLYVKGGQVEVIIDGEVYIGEQGDIFLIRPKQYHSIRVLGDKPLVQPHIHFDLLTYPDRHEVPVSFKNYDEMTETELQYFRPDILAEISPAFPPQLRLESPLYVEQLLFEVIHEYNSQNPFSELTRKWLFMQLLNQLLIEISHRESGKKLQGEYIEKTKQYIEANLTRSVTLGEIANICYLSKNYLGKIFKESTGFSPTRYHMMLRVRKARNLIYYTNMSITEIAALMGFSTIQEFSRAFLHIDGHSPSFYRKPGLQMLDYDSEVFLLPEDG